MPEAIQKSAVGRSEFLAERRSAIGASDVAAVLGLSKWATPWDVWADKTGKLVDDAGNRATSAGTLLEPAVLDYAEQELGPLERAVRVPAVGIPLVSSCDAIVASNGRPVEAKTTGIAGPVYGTWGDALSDLIPDEYLIQVHAQLICTEADLGYLFALIPGRGIVEFHIEPSRRLHDSIIQRVSEWWDRHVIGGLEPPVEPLPAIDVVKRLRKEPGKTIEASEYLVEMLKLREEAKEQAKRDSQLVEEIETKILLELGDAEVAKLPDGSQLTYLETTRKGYTVKPCTYRTMRVKKGK